MELIEFRSVQAHQALTVEGTARYNRNRTSPVVVVRDLVSGQRMLFFSDAQARQWDEIVNAVGDQAMRRILGTEGHNLKLAEPPHHYGEQAGPDARGMINMLELAYESGEGSLRLVAQTTQSFASKPSSTYTFLETSGVAPERIEGDPSPPGQAQVTRARGSQLARVTLDLAGVQRAMEIVQANQTTLRQTYQRLAQLQSMHADTAAMAQALAGSAAPGAMQTSVAATAAELDRMRTELRAGADAVWDQMRAAAAATGGMGGSADLTQVSAALTQLAARIPAQEADLRRAGNDLETHRNGLTLYARLAANAIRMIAALEADNVEQLYRTRAEHTDLVQAVRGALGPTEVHEHVTAAWAAIRAEWTPEVLEARTAELSATIAEREMTTEFHGLLAETLSRQMQLNELVARAEQAGRQAYSKSGQIYTPGSTRVGAGLLAAIEVVRIGLECANQYSAGADAAKARELHGARDGIAKLNWWLRLGVDPHIVLVERKYVSGKRKVVFDGDQQLARQAVVSDKRPPGVPEFDMVAVDGLDAGQLRRLIHRAIVELNTLEDWHSFNDEHPGAPAFKRFDDGWGVQLWSRDEHEYRYQTLDEIAPGLGAELDRLQSELARAQQGKLEAAVAEAGPGKVKGVKDTAWFFGQDRRVTVYDHHGDPKTIDFDSDRPRFFTVSIDGFPPFIDGPKALVKAADLDTYLRLADEWWVTTTGHLQADAYGNYNEELRIHPNREGLAYVKPGNLIEEG
jgi:hypothetical protein